MKMLQKAVSVITAGAMVLTMSVSALAAEYIQLSQEPLDFVHITGEMPEMPGNPAVPIDETAYLMADDATLSISGRWHVFRRHGDAGLPCWLR